MKDTKVIGGIAPRTLDPVDVQVEEGARLVVFTSRPQLAIHPVVIVVPISVIKATAAAILSHEAAVEMAASGSKLNQTTVVRD